MAEPNEQNPPATGTTDAPEAPEAPETTGSEPSGESQLGDAGKRALKAERDARKAAEQRAAAAEAKAQEYEDAQKTETEKLASQAGREKTRADQAEARAADAESRLLRLEVALDKGLPRELIDRLRGETREELEADADTLKGLVGGGEGGATPPGSFDGGAREPEKTPDLDEQIAEAERKGDWATVDRLNLAKLAKAQQKA